MRIAQIVVPGASSFDHKCQRLDHTILAGRHELIVTTLEGAATAQAQVAHVYGAAGFTPPRDDFPIPYVASAAPRKARFIGRRARRPELIVSPLDNLPEAVDEVYFVERGRPRPQEGAPLRAIGSFGPDRPGVVSMIELTQARIQRFRNDIEWLLFDAPPTPDDLALVEAWVDPTRSDDDYDGCVAEALVASRVVVASRTPINVRRLDKGLSGFLVPPGDPNELTHAILTALFKPEVALKKIEGARLTAGKFRPRQRLRVLERLYQAVIA